MKCALYKHIFEYNHSSKVLLESVRHIENIIEVEESSWNVEENEETDDTDEDESQIDFPFDLLSRNLMSQPEKYGKLGNIQVALKIT